MLEALENEVQINLFCDATHANCLATHRLTMEVLVFSNGAALRWYSKRQNTLEMSAFFNGAAVRWYSKRQNTVKMSAFGSEFVAMKIAIEMNAALVYKLCMCSLMVLQMCLVTMQVW